MSYLTMLPNCYYGLNEQSNMTTNQYIINANIFNNKKVLNFLKVALTMSITNYQVSQAQNQPQLKIQKPSMSLTPALHETQSNPSELSQPNEEKREIIPSCQLESVKIQTITQSPARLEKEGQRDTQVATDDQFIIEQREKCTKKSLIAKRKGKKVKIEVVSDFIVQIPEVSRLTTSAIESHTLQRHEICFRKQHLLNRRIMDSNDFIKNKKDKRQIRMLGN